MKCVFYDQNARLNETDCDCLREGWGYSDVQNDSAFIDVHGISLVSDVISVGWYTRIDCGEAYRKCAAIQMLNMERLPPAEGSTHYFVNGAQPEPGRDTYCQLLYVSSASPAVLRVLR